MTIWRGKVSWGVSGGGISKFSGTGGDSERNPGGGSISYSPQRALVLENICVYHVENIRTVVE